MKLPKDPQSDGDGRSVSSIKSILVTTALAPVLAAGVLFALLLHCRMTVTSALFSDAETPGAPAESILPGPAEKNGEA